MDSGSDRLWRAWQRSGTDHSPGEDDGGLPIDDLNLHRYCAVYPYRPDDDPDLRGTTDRELSVRLVRGIPRWALRNTPLIILLMTVLVFGSAELWPGIQGVSEFVPPVVWTNVPFLILAALGILVVASLLIHVELIDIERLYTGAIVYGLASVLLVGAGYSAVLVALSFPEAPEPNVVFVSGYLLVMLVGGLLVYDSILRTEHLIETMAKGRIVGDVDGYETMVDDLSARLDRAILDTGRTVFGKRIRLPTSHALATLTIIAAVAVWITTQGPQNLDFPITIIGNASINFVLGVVAVQFLIVMGWLYDLMNEDISGSNHPNILRYEVYHPDGQGGYRDLGKFVTRVNLLFIVAGVYAVYRLYVHGLRAAPIDITAAVDPGVATVLWVLNFGGPVLIYPFFMGVWLYYSVWQIHLRMIRERERTYAEMTDRFDTDTDWHVRTEGSVWPFNSNQLHSLLYGHLWPVVLTFLPLLVTSLLGV